LLVPRIGKSGVGGFAEALHGPGTESPEGLRRDQEKCISRAVVVGKVVTVLVTIPKSSDMGRGAGGRTNVGSSQGMDERDVSKNARVTGCRESPSMLRGGWG
jgi:hypothetical protein